MHERLRNLWENLRVSIWLPPTGLAVVALGLADALMALDRADPILERLPWLFPGDVDAAREVLGTIGTAVVTIASVAFSITVVALTVAATQYGNLVISAYLRDSFSKWVLGLFVAAFLYCLAVLANLHGDGAVPVRAVTGAILTAIASLAALIAFLHRLTQLLQPERIVAQVGEETCAQLRRIFPERGPGLTEAEGPAPDRSEGWPLAALRNGYLQAITIDSLIATATRHDLVVALEVRPGDFVAAGGPLARVRGGAEPGRQRIARRLRRDFIIAYRRTPTQEPEYGIHQLAQVAVRALSPSTNDPYTALNAIDWLEAALRVAAPRGPAARCRRDSGGRLRLIVPAAGFEELAAAAFNKIRATAPDDPAILLRLMRACGDLRSEFPGHEQVRSVLLGHLRRCRERAAQLPLESDRQACEKLYLELERRFA